MRTSLVVIAAGLFLIPAVPGLAADDAAAIAARAAERYDADHAGIIVATIDQTQEVSARPFFYQTSATRAVRAYRDGRPFAGRIVSLVQDGKPLSGTEFAEADRRFAETSTKPSPAQLPLGTRDQRDYRFAIAACEGCAGGERAIRFESDRRDGAHFTGVATVDGAGRFVRIVAHPYVYEPPADSGDTTWIYVEGLLSETRQALRGHRGPAKGTLTERDRYRFRRVASTDEALALLKAER